MWVLRSSGGMPLLARFDARLVARLIVRFPIEMRLCQSDVSDFVLGDFRKDRDGLRVLRKLFFEVGDELQSGLSPSRFRRADLQTELFTGKAAR